MKRKRIMGIGVFIVTFALLGILDYIYAVKGIVVTPYSSWATIHFSVFMTGLGVSSGLYFYPGLEEVNIKCKLGSHDFEWSKSSLMSPSKRETGFHIYWLVRCERCRIRGLMDIIVPRSGLRLFPMQRRTTLTDEEFQEWSWVDPTFNSSARAIRRV